MAVSVGKPLDALPLFKLAVDSNPKTEQFWLSYIDVLIKVRQFEDAKKALADGIDAGIPEDKLKAFYHQLHGRAPTETNKTAKEQLVQEERTKLAQGKKIKKTKARGSSPRAEPSQDQINLLLEHYRAGRLEEAEALARSLTHKFPRHAFGWKVCGVIFKQTGRLNESLLPMQKAADLAPQDVEARYNLGNTLKEMGKLDAVSYTHLTLPTKRIV